MTMNLSFLSYVNFQFPTDKVEDKEIDSQNILVMQVLQGGEYMSPNMRRMCEFQDPFCWWQTGKRWRYAPLSK